jgi:hypothetical protein
MPLHCQQKSLTEYQNRFNFPIEYQYKYLGVWINNKGNLKSHLRELEIKLDFLSR